MRHCCVWLVTTAPKKHSSLSCRREKGLYRVPQESLQRQREVFDAAQKRAKSATNILKSMSDLRDTGYF